LPKKKLTFLKVISIIKKTRQKKQNSKAKFKFILGLHKIIILDEADSLTEGAQQALRMIISDFADSTRFVLSCNDSTKIIDAIQSRCAILRFSKLDDKRVMARVLEIIQKENVKNSLFFSLESEV
jgi:replication factor C subunit 2/4